MPAAGLFYLTMANFVLWETVTVVCIHCLPCSSGFGFAIFFKVFLFFLCSFRFCFPSALKSSSLVSFCFKLANVSSGCPLYFLYGNYAHSELDCKKLHGIFKARMHQIVIVSDFGILSLLGLNICDCCWLLSWYYKITVCSDSQDLSRSIKANVNSITMWI